VREETGIELDPTSLTPFWYTSTEPKPNRVLLFAVSAELDARRVQPFVADHETSARGVIFGPGGLDEVFAFSLHAEAARRYFAGRGIDRPHGYRDL
jgi:hypothetical protein